VSRSLVLSPAAGLPAARKAAPVHTSEQGKVTSVMPISRNTEMALPIWWPNLQRKGGELVSPDVH
jgi:hypothetical protein